MAIHRLKQVAKISKLGMHADGGGLYLQVSGKPGRINRSWLFRYATAGREHQIGLGSLDTVSVAEARDKALACRKQRLEGIDPLAAKRAQQAAQQAQAADTTKVMTFDKAVAAYVADHAAGWRSAKNTKGWLKAMETYASPLMGKVPVTAVDTDLVLRVLRPIWESKTQTATRVRRSIEQVINFAIHDGGPNPARWKGHLEHKLSGRLIKVKGVKHMEALPYADMPAFWARLQAEGRIGYQAMQFIILTATRTKEVLGAQWDEIDLSGKVWTVPKERMKSHREHRVALSDAAVELLQALPKSESRLVFPGERAATISHNLLLKYLNGMGLTCTVHGFRATFRTWAAEQTSFPREVIEQALAHVVGDTTERSYQRGDLFEKRAKLMNQWATYLTTPVTASVVPLKVVA
jgi:integrase